MDFDANQGGSLKEKTEQIQMTRKWNTESKYVMQAHSLFIIVLMPWNWNDPVYLNNSVDNKWDSKCTHAHPSAIFANYAMFNLMCFNAHSFSEPWYLSLI